MPDANDMVVVEWSGSDEFKVKEMVAHEYLGRPYRYEVYLLCENPEIAFNDIVGERLTVKFVDRDSNPHYFDGFVCSFIQDEKDDESIAQEDQLYGYRAVLVPWLWFLTRGRNCLIFQEMSVVDIFEDVCKERYGFSDYENKLTATYDPLVYCVQYRETAFDFLNRLMEQEGIFYFFKHEEQKNTLILRDSNPPGGESIGELPYRSKDDPEAGRIEHVRQWALHQEIQPVEFQLNDYNFEKPKTKLLAKSKKTRQHAQAKGVVYDFPGLYSEVAQGDNYAKVRIEQHQAAYEVVTATTTSPKIRAGSVFELTDHPHDNQNREYLIVGTKITLTPQFMGEEDSADVESRSSTAYTCEFEAIELQTTYRPPIRTPRPIIQGLQTAVVVGKDGEEIWTDQYGRIKVQFHWDQEGENNENSSCWIRVAQTWAGKKWGTIQLPRIGQEVIVEFLEGNPDRPLVTGSVYNKEVMPPYTLPDNMTQSGLKTHSTKDGTAETFNELRFEDKMGEEEIYFHAEKDFNQVVENNYTLKVGLDDADPGDHTVEIENTREATINSGDDKLTVSSGEQIIDVATNIHIKAGDEIKLECGQSTITLKSDGTITIEGMNIENTATADMKLKGLKGEFVADATLDLKGSATVNIKGGMTNIN